MRAADYAETRTEIDTQHLALIGYSLGGYLPPRAAAMQARIRACIASLLAVDIGAFQTAWPPVVRALPAPAFDALMSTLARFNVTRESMGAERPHQGGQ
jgi:alpha/beta superfamily hydrolase